MFNGFDIELEANIFYERQKTLIEIGNFEFCITYDLMHMSLIQIPAPYGSKRCQIFSNANCL